MRLTVARTLGAAIMAVAAASCGNATAPPAVPTAPTGSSGATLAPGTAAPTAGGAGGSTRSTLPETLSTSPGPAQLTPITRTSVPAEPETIVGTVIAHNLDVPWGLDFFPDGDALVSQRDTATLLRISPDGAVSQVAAVAGVTPTAEGGLLGVAVSPNFTADGLVYVYCTTAADNQVRRGTADEFRTGSESVILGGIPRGEIHDGGRLAFGPGGMLYISTGETGDPALSQDLGSLGGKILRINPDGTIPSDNPFDSSPIWSYGHRNVQGLTWDADGRMWASEFGAASWDEINQIMPGHNYGWPRAEGSSTVPGLTNPAAVFATSSASPSGLAFADGALWMGALRGATLWRVPVAGDGQLGDATAIRVAPARTRSVAVAPDGLLWITTSNTDGRGDPQDGQDQIIAIEP